jgi:hypothetical protein
LFCFVARRPRKTAKEEKRAKRGLFLFQGWPRRLRNCYGAAFVDRKKEKGAAVCGVGGRAPKNNNTVALAKKGILPGRVEMGTPCQSLQPILGCAAVKVNVYFHVK